MKKLVLISMLFSVCVASSQNTGTCTVGNCENGQGTFVWDDGEKYVGEFKDDMRHGQGVMIWENGNKYEGNWINNKINGQGTYVWKNGDKYVGEFRNSDFNGQGTMTFTNNDEVVCVDKGIWKDDNRHGLIERYTFDGKKVYEIEYVNGYISGYLRVYNKNGKVFREDFLKETSESHELDNKVYSDGRLTMCDDNALYFDMSPNSSQKSYFSKIKLGPWGLDDLMKCTFCTERVFVDTRQPVTGLVYEAYSNGNNKYTMNYKNGKYDKKYFQFNNFNGTKLCEIKASVNSRMKKIKIEYSNGSVYKRTTTY